jgi:WD40 repeat protein/class 3 adenylate cyclase
LTRGGTLNPSSGTDVVEPALRIFLIADVRGYTKFTQERGDEAAATLASRFATIAREALTPGGGKVLEFRGDEVLAVFASARQAIRAAVDLQAAFVEATIADPSLPLPVGIGLDAGEPVEVEEGFRGGALNLAARLCSIARPGEILASREVVHLARRIEGISREDRGSVRLKGIAEAVHMSRLTREGWDPDRDVAFQRALGRPDRPGGYELAVCPYRGLAAFQPEDADRFFGREHLVAELVERLDRDRVLFVVGPSGSGKSSLVRAGLIPAIGSGSIRDSQRWAVALFSPRTSPTAELTYQLRHAADAVGASHAVREDSASIPGTTQVRLLAEAICDETGGLLMVIDQFEELFTLNQRGEQSAFLETIAAAVDPAGSRVRAVMALRADFYGTCATFPWLARRVSANQVLVGPMSRADLRKAIEAPAAAFGLRLEDELADAVLDDAGTEPSALPLVSHALAETWRRREGDTLTMAGYRDAGGVAGSISQTADSLYETTFSDDEKDACRRLMLRLVTPGEGTSDTRRRLPMADLDRDHDPEIGRRVAAEMIDARLLTVDRDSIEIAHEALLQSWPRLRGWIEEGRDDLRTRERIERAATEWLAQGRDPDLLYRGTPLQAALEWAAVLGGALGPDQERFLDASRDAADQARARSEAALHRARRVRRGAIAVLAALTVAAVGASLVANSALRESRARYGQALATQARLLADQDPRTAIALAAEASARTGTDPIDARAALVIGSQTLASRFVPSGPPTSVGDALTVVVSPDGSLIVTGNRDGSISTWSATGVNLDRNVPGHTLAIEEMDMTPDGRWLVSGSDDASVLLWDLANPASVPEPRVLGMTTGIVWSVAIASDGSTAASASEDGTIRLWDLETRRQLGPTFADLDFDALTVAFSPDGELLMSGDGLGNVIGWDVDDGRVIIPAFSAHESDVWEIEFAPDGSRFATASSDGRIRIWNTATQRLIAEPFERSAYDVRGVLLDQDEVLAGDEQGRLLVASADGSSRPQVFPSQLAQVVDAAWSAGTLATLASDQLMQIWSPGGEPTALVIDDQTQGAYALAASPDGARIATGDGEGNVRVFSATTGKLQLGPVRLHDGIVWGLAFSEDGTRIASSGEDGDIQVIDAETGDPLDSPPRSGDEVAAVLFVDGQLLSGGADGVVRIWDGGSLDGELGPHLGGVIAMALSPDGVLAVADRSGVVHFWNLDERQEARESLTADDTTIWGLAWSRDGRVLATASDDGVVQLWDTESYALIGSLTPQPGGAAAAAFLDDGATILTTSRDGSVSLWDVTEAAPLGEPFAGNEATAWRAIALPGMRFATSSEDGTVRIWDVLDADRACDRAAGSLGLAALGAYLGEGEEPVACVGG